MKGKTKIKLLIMAVLTSASANLIAQESQSTSNVYRYPLSITTGSNENALTLLPSDFFNSESEDDWEAIEDYVSPNVYSGAINHTAWMPEFKSVTPANFSDPVAFIQDREYTKTIAHYTQGQERNRVTEEVRLVGEREDFLYSETKMESREVVVSLEQRYISQSYNCSVYSPSEDTVIKGTEFEQTRTCSKDIAYFHVYKHRGEEVYSWMPWEHDVDTMFKEKRTSVGTMEVDTENLDVVFDLGTFYLEDDVIVRTFNVDKPSSSTDYNMAVFDINYSHTFPQDVAYLIFNPNGELVLSVTEASNQAGERHYSKPVPSLGGILNGEWTVLAEDAYEGDGGYISVKITLPYNAN